MHSLGSRLADDRSLASRLEARPAKGHAPHIWRLGDSPVSSRFCERLADNHGLKRDALRDLLELRASPVYFPQGHVIAKAFEPVPPAIIISGWVSAQCMLENGERQVFDLLAPGDAIGISENCRKRFGHSFVALTDIFAVDCASLLRSRPQRISGLSQALSSLEQEAEGRLYDHIERLGRRNSHKPAITTLVETSIRRTRD